MNRTLRQVASFSCARFSARLGRLLVWLLVLQILLPAPRALASPPVGPSDGSTLAADRSSNSAGSGGGAVDTDAFSGGATYGIPIELPPGTGGMTPELKLGYSSASRSDSWVGLGWSLGVSSIARSLKKGTPSHQASDTYEIDGQPLVVDLEEEDPTLFHTRRESFLRIKRNVDDTWTVTRKDGVKLIFGRDVSADRGTAPPDPDNARIKNPAPLAGTPASETTFHRAAGN